MNRLLLFTFAVTSSLPVMAAEYFVATNGSNKNTGSINQPFSSIQYAAKQMQAGDTTYIRQGNYFEEINLSKLKGTAKKPFNFKAYKDESVTLDGTINIKQNWTKYKGNIYQTKLTQDIWQLFVDDKSMTSARWPNGNWYDRSVWDKSQSMMWPQKGKLGKYYNQELADFDFSLAGGIAVVNSASFKTYQRKITEHTVGNDHFSYDTQGVTSHFSFKESVKRHGYFIEGKLGLLDEENEWFYDVKTKQLYLWAKDGVNPQSLNIRGKVQSYALNINRSEHVTFKGINFFGTSFNIKKSQFVTVEDTTLLYPSYSKRMLSDIAPIKVTKMVVKKEHDAAYNQLKNCKIAYTDGPAIEMNGKGNLIENCYMHDIDYSCTYKGGYTLNMVNASELTFRRNTIHTTGCSELFKAGVRNLVELNNLSDSGHLQNDGSMVQLSVKQQPGGIVRNNWVHNSVKQGIRFDNKNTPNAPYGNNGQVSNNVAWHTDRIFFKGESHFIFNNLSFDNHQNDLIISSNTKIQGHNHKTITRNNISNKFSGHRTKPRKKYPLPGIVDHNWDGVTLGLDVRSQLRDPDNFDFRPKQGATLIDSGAVVKGKSIKFIGKAPDIGPYEFGDSHYWIPGYQAKNASSPVPKLSAVNVKSDADLMWLEAYKATNHSVYFANSKNDILAATPTSSAYQGSFANNIFTPKHLKLGETYYWRVDALKDGKTIKGPIWHFTVEQ